MLHGLIPKCNCSCIAFKSQAPMGEADGNLAIIPEQNDSYQEDRFLPLDNKRISPRPRRKRLAKTSA